MSEKSDLPELMAGLSIEGVGSSGIVLATMDQHFEVQLSRGEARAMPLGLEVAIELNGGALLVPTTVVGTPTNWNKKDEHEVLRFDAADEHLVMIQAALRGERALRVPMVGSRAVRALIETPGSDDVLGGAIIDVSETGMGVIVKTADDARLAGNAANTSAEESWIVQVSFHLPGNKSPIYLIGEVIYRACVRNCVKYGLHFDEARTRAEFPNQTQTVDSHMMSYQQKLMSAA